MASIDVLEQLDINPDGFKNRDWDRLLRSLGWEFDRTAKHGAFYKHRLFGAVSVPGTPGDFRTNRNMLSQIKQQVRAYFDQTVVSGASDEALDPTDPTLPREATWEAIQQMLKVDDLAEVFDTTPRQVRRWCDELNIKLFTPPHSADLYIPDAHFERLEEYAPEQEAEEPLTPQEKKLVRIINLCQELDRPKSTLLNWCSEMGLHMESRELGRHVAHYTDEDGAAALRDASEQRQRRLRQQTPSPDPKPTRAVEPPPAPEPEPEPEPAPLQPYIPPAKTTGMDAFQGMLSDVRVEVTLPMKAAAYCLLKGLDPQQFLQEMVEAKLHDLMERL